MIAVCLIGLAAAIWGAVFLWQRRQAPWRAHIDAADRYVRLGQGIPAERELRAAAALAPDNPNVWELLGEFYLSTGTWNRAVEAFDRLRRVSPQTPHVYSRLAACALNAEDEVGALKYAEEALKRDADDITGLSVAAVLLLRAGDEQRRLRYLRRLVMLAPDEPDFLMMLGSELTDRHLYSEARPVLERLLKLEPGNARAHAFLGIGIMNENPSPEGMSRAETEFKLSAGADAKAALPRFQLGKLYRQKGDMATAIFCLQQAAELMPEKPNIYYELSAVLLRAGKVQLAEKARHRFETLRQEMDLEGALMQRCATFPDNFEYHLQAGELNLKHGDFRRAQGYLERAKVLRPEDPRAEAALVRVAALARETEAIKAIRTRAAVVALTQHGTSTSRSPDQ